MIGRTISHYRVLEKLGGGGMGVVYKAEDTRLKRLVALKFLPPELTRDDDSKQRFVQEAQAASALDHPNLCTIHEIDETDDGQLFLALAYYDGETLKKRIERGALPVDEALDIALQVARGLERAHESDIIHRDIKPANVMLTRRGEVKIVDFGLAKLVGQTGLTQTGTTLGTVAYMSPEQTKGVDADTRADIWALGVMLYQMLTGQLPFRGEQQLVMMNAIQNEKPKPVGQLRADLPDALTTAIDRALQKDREARYGSATELRDALEHCQTTLRGPAEPASASSAVWQLLRRPAVAIPAVLTLAALIYFGASFAERTGNERWAREEALPEIGELIEQDDYVEAFALAEQAEQYIPADPTLTSLWPSMSVHWSLETDPAGAEVDVKEYGAADDVWVRLGTTPIANIRVSRGFKHWRISKAGFETVELARTSAASGSQWQLTLAEAGTQPPDMVLVPNATATPNSQGMLTGNDPSEPIPLGAFLIDKHEVTNEQFKEFVDAGGYRARVYWTHEFVRDGQVISWDDAVAEFVDATGRPGPVEWELGDYPNGEDDLPVRGVSWYEAAAFAEFAGKSLPTIFHWDRASGRGRASDIIPLSNFGNQGPSPVGTHGSLSPFGAYDMAGNVREWCLNASGNNRWILGGAWNDPIYMFTFGNAQSPFDRSPTNGFRCVRYLDDEAVAAAARPVELSTRNYDEEEPVAQDIFEIYKAQFAYDEGELGTTVESSEDFEDWVDHAVTFDAPYGDDRIIAHVLLPKNVAPPYQTVVYFPGSNAIATPSSTAARNRLAFIVRSGRALMFPIYWGTWERSGTVTSTWPNTTYGYVDDVVKWVQEFRRSIDYLESRDDIDMTKLAYLGISWGGRLGAIIPAVEDRLRASVLYLGGLASARARPEVDQINYVSRVTIPTLMLNGRFDALEPLETSQLPMLRLLGPPEEDKRHVIFDTDHRVPINAGIRETLDWLDRYLGPVQ